MWPFSKKKDKETLLSKVKILTKEGKEKAIKETVKHIKKEIILAAKKGKSSLTREIRLDIKDKVLKLIQEEGFTAEIDYEYGYYIRIKW